MSYEKTNIDGFYKDSSTGVCINKQMAEFEQIKARRQKLKEEAELRKEVGELKQDLGEIKNLLRKLLGD